MLDSAQLELGSTATEYAAYSPIELAKIGTYNDRVYEEGGKWYVEKQLGKLVLGQGNQSRWGVYGTGTPNYFYYWSGVPNAKQSLIDDPSIMSNYGLQGSVGTTDTSQGIMIASGGLMRVRLGEEMSLDDWKALIRGTNMVVYYALATPTTTEITNQTLIDQLEALASATLNQGVNNIFTEIATGNAMPTLELNWVEWEKYNKHNVYIWNDDIDDWQVIVS